MSKKLQPHHHLYEIQFAERLTDARLWLRCAQELLASARILEAAVKQYWAEVRLEGTQVVSAPSRPCPQGPYFMLVAYALENYFKAVLIHRNANSLRNRLPARIPAYIKKHDLMQLAKDTRVRLNVPEEELLTRLTRNSTWAARYPVPTGPNALRAVEEFSDGRAYLTAYLAPGDIDRINAFAGRLKSLADEEIGEIAQQDVPPYPPSSGSTA